MLANGAICTVCPRRCGVARGFTFSDTNTGYCGMGQLPVVARVMLHMWEEPCLSGSNGAGAVFFSGCPLSCVYCQNYSISQGREGRPISIARLREIFAELIAAGAHNIDLVSPTHFSEAILVALEEKVSVPVVYNSGGYDLVETLRRFAGKIQIYLPDLKYMSRTLAARYSAAADYPEIATAAIREMYRQTGPYVLDDNGLLQQGVLIRHLVLPGQLENTFDVLDWVAETFRPGQVLISLMAQYTPAGRAGDFPELNQSLTVEEYQRAVDYMWGLGIEDGFVQEMEASSTRFIPDFDGSGV